MNGALAVFRELVPYSHCLRGARSRSAKADAAHVLAKDAAAGAGWARATAVPHARLGSSSDSSSSAPLAQDKVLAPLDCCSRACVLTCARCRCACVSCMQSLRTLTAGAVDVRLFLLRSLERVYVLPACHMSHVMCHMSHVTCHMSHVMCHMSCVMCHMSRVILSLTLSLSLSTLLSVTATARAGGGQVSAAAARKR